MGVGDSGMGCVRAMMIRRCAAVASVSGKLIHSGHAERDGRDTKSAVSHGELPSMLGGAGRRRMPPLPSEIGRRRASTSSSIVTNTCVRMLRAVTGDRPRNTDSGAEISTTSALRLGQYCSSHLADVLHAKAWRECSLAPNKRTAVQGRAGARSKAARRFRLLLWPRRVLTAARDLTISAPLALATGECQDNCAPRAGDFERGNIHEIPSPA